ncbi:MAG TPA: DNA lyase [Baekduia sp.]|nr:DNA lyase [Baekduia sp.]
MVVPKAEWKRPRASRVRTLRERLADFYGTPRMAPHEDPLAELILTVLSQSTNDRNRDVAYLRLRERWHDWPAVLDAPVEEIEEAIRPGGISKVKSKRIKAILEAIAAENPAVWAELRVNNTAKSAHTAEGGDGVGGGDGVEGGDPLSLDWMRDAPLTVSRDFLTALPGVGRKTAACVLLFAYGLHDIPVDTHVSRVGWRLGLFRPGASFKELHDEINAFTPPGLGLEFHVNMLRHGRRICAAKAPLCSQCVLATMCPSRKLVPGAK